MNYLVGVSCAKKKNGDIYYRSSITYKSKHISLGSYSLQTEANKAYLEATQILTSYKYKLKDYSELFTLSFDKWVVLHNYKDNGYYVKNPIYLTSNFFTYYLDPDTELLFDVDDLFYYSTHKIMHRSGYFFVNDYGMQINIRLRYGIKNFAVVGRDYYFIDNNPYNFRYDNIQIINRYVGVRKKTFHDSTIYMAKIHVNGDFVIGRYKTEEIAAIAYNKAVDVLTSNGISKNFSKNFLENLNTEQYLDRYSKISISRKLRNLANK